MSFSMEEMGSIGGVEMRLLEFLEGRGGATVREAADEWGAERGCVKTTVQQMMERLRKKGYLQRSKSGGQYVYRATRSSAEAADGLVKRFVDGVLGGSRSPLLAYLREADLDEADRASLRKLVDELEGRP